MVMQLTLYFLCLMLYIFSGPLIKWILVKMSTLSMPKSDNIGLLIGYMERLLIIIFIIFRLSN